MKVKILTCLIVLKISIASSPNENIKDDFGAYYYFDEIDKIVDETYAETKAKYTNQIMQMIDKIRELETEKNKAISNVIINYDKKIAVMEQKHDLELQALKIKMQLNHNKFLFGGMGLGIGITAGTVFLLDSIELPLFKITF